MVDWIGLASGKPSIGRSGSSPFGPLEPKTEKWFIACTIAFMVIMVAIIELTRG